MSKPILKVFIGYDTNETDAYDVCWKSLTKNSSIPLSIEMLSERKLRHMGLYWRRWIIDDQGQFLDSNDQKPFSTEFSFTRFLIPSLCQWNGLALYCDCDFLWRGDVGKILTHFDKDFAVSVVKHIHNPDENIKMTGQAQTKYYRKNWSSMIFWNNAHSKNLLLTPGKVNNESGQWLHSFGWLEKHEIGELDLEWNWLVNVSPEINNPLAVHYTKGTPDMMGYENAPYADEWWGMLNDH